MTPAPGLHSRTPFAGLKHLARRAPLPCSVLASNFGTDARIELSGQCDFRHSPPIKATSSPPWSL